MDFNSKKCPENVSLEQLHKELGKESTVYTDKQLLWDAIYHLNHNLNEFGFYNDPKDPFEMKVIKSTQVPKNVPVVYPKDIIYDDMDDKKVKGGKGGKTRLKKKKKNKTQKGGAPNEINFVNENVIPLRFRRFGMVPNVGMMNTLTNIRGLKLFGSSLPLHTLGNDGGLAPGRNLSTTDDALKNFLFFLSVIGIEHFISLQGCSVPGLPPNNQATCMNNGPGGVMWEENAFNTARQLCELLLPEFSPTAVPQKDLRFINHMIQDMSPGSTRAWRNLSQEPDTHDTRTLVHCFAGYGRTGVMLLFYWLRDNRNNSLLPQLQLGDMFMGYATSAGMYNSLRAFLIAAIRISNHRGSAAQQTTIGRFNAADIPDEVFELNAGGVPSRAKARLFVSRINYIMWCLGYHTGTPFPLYQLPNAGCTPANVFVPNGMYTTVTVAGLGMPPAGAPAWGAIG